MTVYVVYRKTEDHCYLSGVDRTYFSIVAVCKNEAVAKKMCKNDPEYEYESSELI